MGRKSRRQAFLPKAFAGTTGLLFRLQTNRLEGLFLLTDDVSSGCLPVLHLCVLTILVQIHPRLAQIGLLPPALQIKAGGDPNVKHRRGDPRGSAVTRVGEDINQLVYSNICLLH